MGHVKIGLIAGLIAVTLTTALNVIGCLVGLLPEPMDMKYMAELFVDPVIYPFASFVLGLVIHVLSGGVIGIVYALLIRRRTVITGMLFMVLNWLVMMLALFPLTGRGF